ncbi:hypothetical protein ABIE56_004185 [Luteibacter sp. 621]|uniref:hypothetical protein n=1 Tax=Luteibacter sp. 621 TaxID=3373916 RepID=UPI003D1D2330
MAHVPRKLVLAALVATTSMAQADEPPPLRYTITPVLVKGVLTALDISLEAATGSDGSLLLRIGSPPGDIRATAAVDSSKAGLIKVTAVAGAPFVLHYRITADADPAAKHNVGPFFTADWSNSACPMILALPDDWVPRKIDLDWRLPAGWRGLSSIPAGVPVDAGKLGMSGCLIGRHIVDASRPLGTTATLHAYTTDAQASASLIDSAAAALRPFAEAAGSGAVDFPMYIGVLPTTGTFYSAWSSGGFMSVVQGPDAPGRELAAPLIQNYASMVQAGTGDPATAWYTHGLRTYLAVSQVTETNTLARQDVAAYLDQISADYGNSPFRRASNAQVVADWQRAPLIQNIPTQRGLLFGWLLDAQLRNATGGKACMADVLRAMDPKEADPAAALVAAIKAAGGGDITPLYEKYIVRGELLQLPPGALGPCMSVSTLADSSGWQVQGIADTCSP